MKRRKIRNRIRNGLLTLSVVIAIIIFVLASVQLTITNPFGVLGMILSGSYILLFCWANEDEE